MRIGIPRSPFFEQLDPEIDAAVRAAIAVLVGLTGPTRDVTIAAPDTYALLDAETYAYHAPLLADAAKRALYNPLTLQRIMGGASVTAQVYIEQRRRMQIARNTIGDVVRRRRRARRADVHGAAGRRSKQCSRIPAREPSLIRNTLPFNVFGIPAISVPCGFTRAGLPIGMQIIGPRLGEARVLALAHAYEQATDWHRREPPIA